VKFTLQSPSYLLEKETNLSVYNCDKTKEECKVNFDFSPTFTESFKATSAICEINFGLNEPTGEESKCNPNTVTFPL
jgi:hypothetical protein